MGLVVDPDSIEWEPWDLYVPGTPPNDRIPGAPAWDGRVGGWVRVLSPPEMGHGLTILLRHVAPAGMALRNRGVSRSHEQVLVLGSGSDGNYMQAGQFAFRIPGIPHGGLMAGEHLNLVHFDGLGDEVFTYDAVPERNTQNRPEPPRLTNPIVGSPSNFTVNPSLMEWEPYASLGCVSGPEPNSGDSVSVKVLSKPENGDGWNLLSKMTPPRGKSIRIRTRARAHRLDWSFGPQYDHLREKIRPAGCYSFNEPGDVRDVSVDSEFIEWVHYSGDPDETISLEVI